MSDKPTFKPETEADALNRLFIENGLDIKTDIFRKAYVDKGVHKKLVMITRTGIEKIQRNNNIHVTYEHIRMDHDFCVVKATGYFVNDKNELPQETYGSAHEKNVGKEMYYLPEIAEKRALSRVVLKLTKLYQHEGVMGEDETPPERDKAGKIGELMKNTPASEGVKKEIQSPTKPITK